MKIQKPLGCVSSGFCVFRLPTPIFARYERFQTFSNASVDALRTDRGAGCFGFVFFGQDQAYGGTRETHLSSDLGDVFS